MKRQKQKGVTLTGMLVGSVVAILVLLLVFRVLPAFMEYNTIQRIFKAMAEDPQLRSGRRADFERSWASRASVEDIKSLDGALIDYQKEPNGWVVSAEYSVKIPLFRNVNACLDFKPTTKD